MNLRAAVAILVAVCISSVSLFVVIHNGGTNDPADPSDQDVPEREDEPILPEGIFYDGDTHTLSTDSVVDWVVVDRYHAYMNDRNTVYEGETYVSDRISLDVGFYTVTVGRTSFDVFVDGDVVREVSWKYSSGGVVHNLTLTYKVPFKEFKESCDASREWNDETIKLTGYMSFTEMGHIVVVDDTIRELESSLRLKYTAVGGSPDDRQGYADFLACFVQLAIQYPPSVDGRSFDYYVWGENEYWCVPLETLYHAIGDCEDTAALLCSLYIAAGYQAAMGGHAGHVFAGVVIEEFEEREFTGFPAYVLSGGYGIIGFDESGGPIYNDVYYRSVETIRGQLPAGYLAGGNSHLGGNTFWGYAGLYPVSG